MSRRAPREPGVTAGAEARGLHGREPGARLGEAGPSHRPAYGKISVCPGGAGGSVHRRRETWARRSRDAPPDALPGAGGQAPQPEPLGARMVVERDMLGSTAVKVRGNRYTDWGSSWTAERRLDVTPLTATRSRRPTGAERSWVGSSLVSAGPASTPAVAAGDPGRPPPLPPADARRRRGPARDPVCLPRS